MIRIISPTEENKKNIGAVAFVCSNIVKCIKKVRSDSVCYTFASGNKIVQLLKSFLALVKAFFWLVKGDTVAFIYPTIPMYPATSELKYCVANALYRLLFAVKKKRGKILFIIIDLPKEQEESFNLKHIQIPYDKFLGFENRILSESSKVIYFSEGFKLLAEKRGIELASDSVVCSVGYIEPKKKTKKDNQVTKVFYSGELTRDYEKSKLTEICNNLTEKEELIICGRNGEWLKDLSKPNVHYMGYVDSQKHDEIAAQCDFGLVMYPDEGYYRYVTPSKLNAYISLKLPVLAISNLTLEGVFAKYSIGQCVGEKDLVSAFREWCDKKTFGNYAKIYSEEDFYSAFLSSFENALK